MTKKTLATRPPIATIIAGANASGKSTLISSLYQSGFFGEEQFVGPDLILSNEISHTISRKKDSLYFVRNHYDEELYTRENYLKAFSIADARREALIEKRKDFVMETVLSTDSKMELIAALKAKGYFVRIIYIGVEEDITNAEYLIRRLRDGGHDVPMHKLIKRKANSLQKLHTIIRSENIDQTILIDNSIPDEPPHVIATYNFGYKPFENGSVRPASWRVFADGFFREQDHDGTIILTDSMISEVKAVIGSLEKTIKYFFLQTTKLHSYSWGNSFIGEKIDDKRNITALIYSTNAGIFDGHCNRGGHLDVSDDAHWYGNFGRDDLFRTSLIAGWEQKDEILTIETLNSTYIFEIIKGNVDTSRIKLAPREIVDEVKARNAVKCLRYWCQVNASGFLEGLISVTEMPYPMTKQEAIDYVSLGRAVSSDGYIARIVLGPATVGDRLVGGKLL
jgi:predicted ABC-type ATPase